MRPILVMLSDSTATYYVGTVSNVKQSAIKKDEVGRLYYTHAGQVIHLPSQFQRSN